MYKIYNFNRYLLSNPHTVPRPQCFDAHSTEYEVRRVQTKSPGFHKARIEWWVQCTNNIVNASSNATCNGNKIGQCFWELKLMCIGQSHTHQLVSQLVSRLQYLQAVWQ